MDEVKIDLSKYPKITDDLTTIESKIKFLEQKEKELKDLEYELNQKEQDLYKREEDLKSQKEYIINARSDLADKEKKLAVNKDILQQIEIEKEEWEKRKSEALKAERNLKNVV